MGNRASQSWVRRNLNKLAKEYSGVEFRVLYASNGETAILPVNPETGEAEMTNPQKFVVKNLWNKMCAHDKIDPRAVFVAFSDSNPYTRAYNEAMVKLNKGGC
jgi:hypothetical protein